MNENLDKIFPRDFYGRVSLGLTGVVISPCAGFMSLVLLQRETPREWEPWFYMLVAQEFFLALFLYFSCSLIWALATPAWMEKILLAVHKRMGIALALFALPLCIGFLWHLITKVF